MNEKKDYYNNDVNIDEVKKQKIIHTNIINKKLFNKNSIRKQKRLFQMQKRLALLNEEELSEIESDIDKINNEENEKINNNINSFQNLCKVDKNEKNKVKPNKSNLLFNCDPMEEVKIINQNYSTGMKNENVHINSGNLIENNNGVINERYKEISKEIDNIDNKEEELSIKKKNTNSNTNDEDKSNSEIYFCNELEQNKMKNLNNNDYIDGIAFTKIINDDNDKFFSRNNDNLKNEERENNDKLNSKDFISLHLTNNTNNQDNFNINNFDFFNIINDSNENDNNINKNENNMNEDEKNNSMIVNENITNTNIIINNNENKEDENVELNISNLEIDINQINNDSNCEQNEDELAMSGTNLNEFAKKYLSSKSKSFIKFNNNLTSRAAANNLKNSPSYMLALCPELLDGLDKKNMIKDNYAVKDAISEEMESDTFTPRQTEKINDYSMNKNTIDTRSINTNDYQVNNTLRNKDIKGPWNFGFKIDSKDNKPYISPKCFNKNKTKINKNKLKDIKDIDLELKKFCNSKKKNINVKFNSNVIIVNNNILSNNILISSNNNNNINNSNNNIIINNHNHSENKHVKNGILKNSEKKNALNNDNIKIKIKHQKAKSLINNSQINSLILSGNTVKNKINNSHHSPKQVTFKLFQNQNCSHKKLKNLGCKKNLFYNERLGNDSKNKQKKYFSNDNYINNNNNSLSNKKNYKKNNSNVMMINNLKLCKSEKRTKKVDFKLKYTSISKKNNTQLLTKSNPYKHSKLNSDNSNNKKICFTEKANKSKNYISFISHMKKNTPFHINNITEQNVNHSKKLSQQIYDGYKFFMNSLNNNNFNNRVKDINKINIGLNNFNVTKSTPLSNYFSFNKNKINNNSNTNYNNSVTFIKKNRAHKEDKNFHVISIHNKSKTSFISPSYQNLNKNKLFNKNFISHNCNKSINKNKNSENKSSKNLKKNYIKKNNNKFNEIKKIVKDLSVKIIHKKINTIGNSHDLTKLLNNNLNNGFHKQLKGSASNNNLKKNFNKHKIIMALQHIKFLPNENYSKALNELYKSKKNLFIILVYTDSIQRYIFRGLYEINSTDQKTANKLFAPGYGRNTININSLNSFFNYQSNNGEFVKIKFSNDIDKKFGSDTVIVY